MDYSDDSENLLHHHSFWVCTIGIKLPQILAEKQRLGMLCGILSVNEVASGRGNRPYFGVLLFSSKSREFYPKGGGGVCC